MACSAELTELAGAYGVAVSYRDASERIVDVDPAVVIDVLAALDVDARTDDALADALAAVRNRPRGALPPTVVVTEGSGRTLPGPGVVTLEDGTERSVTSLGADLPLGYHTLRVDGGEHTVVVAPASLEEVARTWGWMVQLYALHSAGSWGCGDLGDLGELLARARDEHGAGALLCNPLHALALEPTVEHSPYSPSSRRFVHPLYLRIADTAAYAAAPAQLRGEVDALAPERGELIDYDAVWHAKRTALELLRPYAPDVPDTLDEGLRDVATWYALAERHGPNWTEWPAGLRSPDGPDVAAARAELAERVTFHAWCQAMLDAQLDRAREGAAGMAVGLIADLAVGCSGRGADAWALQDSLATDVTVGAPPDDFNPHGQDWSLPPWRPDALARSGYRPMREMLRAVLRHADGVRVDHVAGLWRLWWIPPGRSAREGTYVSYDAEAMLAVLVLEARRAGAVVVGEDLGTVEDEVRDGLTAARVLGCAVLWFQRDDDGELMPPATWPVETLGSVSTHDLPTAVGFLRDEHVRVRAEAGLLDGDEVEGAREQAERDRAELTRLLVDEGLLGSSRPHSEDEVVAAMHALLARASSRVVLAAFTDVIDEPRQPNLPGTVDAYPNWRIPLPLDLDDLLDDARVQATVRALRARAQSSGS